jgi:hypothetical protein
LREQRHQPGARYPAAPTTVNITALPIEPTALAFYAHELGFFSREGIDARITVINDPQQAPAAVLSGAAVFSSFSVSGLAVLKSRGAPVRLIAAGALYVPTVPTTAPVAAKGQRFKTAGDLVGKTIAIDAPKTPAHIGLLRRLKRKRIEAEDVHFVHMPFAQMVGPLSRGTVDAAVVPRAGPDGRAAARRHANRSHLQCGLRAIASPPSGWRAGTSIRTSPHASDARFRRRPCGRTKRITSAPAAPFSPSTRSWTQR